MERLTKRTYTISEPHVEMVTAVPGINVTNILDRLAAYEDTGLEPQTISEILDSVSEWYDAHKEGRLLVLPCKVGDTVCYLNPFDEIENGKITMIQQKADGTWKFRVTTSFSHDVTIDAIGKTVFLAREEAEAKLKEVNGDG